MKVNNYPLKTPSTGDRLFGSDVNGDQKQFNMSAVSNNVFQYEIGEYAADQGGVIFHRYLDGDTQNYLVVGLSNLSSSQTWSNVTSALIGATAQSTWDGLSNSTAIVNQSGQTSSAAKLCLDSTNNSQTDWYLPAIDELNLLYNNKFNVDRTLSGNSSFGAIAGAVQVGAVGYWSSTELSLNSAAYFVFGNGLTQFFNKSGTFEVRAIRKFSI